MSITFRVTSDDDRTTIDPTPITIRQLVAFRIFARANNILIDDVPENDHITRTLSFEASICGFALAVLSRIFEFAEAMIAVIDEAQFRQRQLRFYKDDRTGELMLALSDTIDGSVDLDLANGNACAVLEALDTKPNSTGIMPIADFRERLADPRVRARFEAAEIGHYLPRLDRLAAIAAYEQEPRLVWA
ncbi:MAG: hypothetical protein H0X36_01565 [Sphingomonadaceae bacterium]|nr:hypothetical protein [Sphingomonadaceae bacterium]